MTADLAGKVCLFRRPGGIPDCESSQSSDPSSLMLVGSYQHKDWVRCLAEIDGIVVSCCKTGEVRCASLGLSSRSHQGLLFDVTALRGHQADPEALVVQSAWHVNRPDNVWRLQGETSIEDSRSPLKQNQDSTSSDQQQVFGVVIDQSGIVVGCHDRSIRQYWFSKHGCALVFAS